MAKEDMDTTVGVTLQRDLPGIINDATAEIIYVVVFSILGGLVTAFGTFTNTINIIVFLKQGFSDTVNVSLFTLALSDMSSLIVSAWMSLLWNPLFYNSGVPLISIEVFPLTGGWPYGFFARLTSCITSYITLERCLCVLIPLKVKTVVTPKVAVSVLVSIFLFNLITILPEYITSYIGWKFDATYNRSMLGLLFTKDWDKISVLSFTFGAYIQIISFLFVVLFTAILVIKIKEKSKWRSATSNVGQGSQKGTQKKDTKTVKMVILIAVIFTICYFPAMVSYLTTSTLPGFNTVGRYHNIFLVSWSLSALAECINSSVNIFVYYTMSSNFRATYDRILKISNLTKFHWL